MSNRHPQHRPNPPDPLDLRIGQQQRVAIFYLLQEAFPPGHSHWMGGEVGGEEQRILEEHMRKTLRVLELSAGYTVADILKNFIVVSGSPRELLLMLEAMPRILSFAMSHGIRSRGEVEGAVAALKERILRLLSSFGLEMTFDGEGHFVETKLDTVPRAISDLPKLDALRRDLDVALGARQLTGLVFIDLDNFKHVNDTKGHSAGNECLRLAVEAIQAAVLGKGKLYRYGGDEFCVMLPNFSSEEAAATAERVRIATCEANAGGDIQVTASIGVAASSMPQLNQADPLIEAADRAMYESKNAGKNRVTLVTLPVGSRSRLPTPLIDAALDEIARNTRKLGANAQLLETKYLEALIDFGEKNNWKHTIQNVLSNLYDLRDATRRQLAFTSWQEAHKNREMNYLPATSHVVRDLEWLKRDGAQGKP